MDTTAFTDVYETYSPDFMPGGGGGRVGGRPPPQNNLNDTEFILLAVFCTSIGFFIVTSNSLVIFSILRPKNRDKLATPTNILISQLSLADFLVGVLTVPSFILGQKMGWPNNYVGCIFNLIFSIQVPPIVSYVGCLFLSLERFLAIEYPFTWERLVNNRTVIIVSIVTWVVPIAILHVIFGYNLGWNRMNICLYKLVVPIDFTVYVSHYLLRLTPLLAMIIMYTKIFFTARRHLMTVVPGPAAPGAAAGAKPGLQSEGKEGAEHKTSFVKQIRVAQKCFVIVVVIIIFLLPQAINTDIRKYAGWSHKTFQVSTVILLMINSAINPFMYARSNARLKVEILKLIYFWKNPKDLVGLQNNVSTSTET